MRNLTAVVKLERFSTEKIQEIISTGENNMNATNVLQSSEDKLTLATARMSIKENNVEPIKGTPELDESIIMMSPKTTNIVTLSDDEMDVEDAEVANPNNEMPPPIKTRKGRPKGQLKKIKTEADSLSSSNSSETVIRSTRSKKPKEKSVPRPQIEVKKESSEPVKVANITAESVYEDARDVPAKIVSPVAPVPPVN